MNGAVTSDLVKVKGLLSHVQDLNFEGIRVKRLAKIPSNVPRPLLFRLSIRR